MPGKSKVTAAQARLKTDLGEPAARPQKLAKKSKPSSSKPQHVEQPSDQDEDVEAGSGEEWEEASSDQDETDEEGSGDENESSEDEDVDAEGIERLVKALGEDGLDDFDRASLAALTDDNEESRSAEEEEIAEGDDEEEREQQTEAQEEHSEAADKEEDVIALDEVDEVDDDVVPRQKIEIDNKVRRPANYSRRGLLDHGIFRLHWNGYETVSSLTHSYRGRKFWSLHIRTQSMSM